MSLIDTGSIDLDVDVNTLTIGAERTIGASCSHGVLSLTIPVADRAKPRKISVERRDAHREITPNHAEETAGSAGRSRAGRDAVASCACVPPGSGLTVRPHRASRF